MEMFVCAVFDQAAGVFGRPFYCRAKGEATRGFMDEVARVGSADQPNPISSHPQDFALFCLATFDDNSGVFRPLDVPERLLTGIQAKA